MNIPPSLGEHSLVCYNGVYCINLRLIVRQQKIHSSFFFLIFLQEYFNKLWPYHPGGLGEILLGLLIFLPKFEKMYIPKCSRMPLLPDPTPYGKDTHTHTHTHTLKCYNAYFILKLLYSGRSGERPWSPKWSLTEIRRRARQFLSLM
jgi:hypothetical protein